jgi:hypothetical protein
VREDNTAGDDPSPEPPLVESSAAVVDNLGAKERPGVPLFEEPLEKAHIEGVKCDNPTAIANAANIEPHGVPAVESMPALEGATQDEHGITFEIQLESLDDRASDHAEAVNTPIGA